MRRHFDRRARVAVAAALLAPAMLLTPAVASAATTDDNPGSGQWWDTQSGQDQRQAQEDRESRAQRDDGDSDPASQFDDGDSDDAAQDNGDRRRPNNDSDVAAQRYANEVGFAPDRREDRSERDTDPAADEPDTQTDVPTDDRAQEPAPGEDSGARESDERASEEPAAERSADKAEKPAGEDKFSVETPDKNFDEGMDRARRGRDSDVPKSGAEDQSEKGDAAKDKPAKSVKAKSDKPGKTKGKSGKR